MGVLGRAAPHPKEKETTAMRHEGQPPLICGTTGCLTEFHFNQADLQPGFRKLYDHWSGSHPGTSVAVLQSNLKEKTNAT